MESLQQAGQAAPLPAIQKSGQALFPGEKLGEPEACLLRSTLGALEGLRRGAVFLHRSI